MAKILNLNKILLEENKMYFLSSICMVLLLSLLYFRFSNISTDSKEILIDWMGGSAEQSYSFSILVLKMSFISIIFIYLGRIIDELRSNLLYFLAPRLGNVKNVIISFILPVLLHGILLVIIFEVAFLIALVINIHDCKALINITYGFISYIIIECISMAGVILIYLIMELVFAVNNAILIIIALYLVNSIVPYNIPIAIFTSKLGDMYCNGKIIQFGFYIFISTIVIAFIFKCLIDKREVKLC
jgi:hypothetical protein